MLNQSCLAREVQFYYFFLCTNDNGVLDRGRVITNLSPCTFCSPAVKGSSFLPLFSRNGLVHLLWDKCKQLHRAFQAEFRTERREEGISAKIVPQACGVVQQMDR